MSELELTEVRMPELGVENGAKIARWMVEPGESVTAGQPICEIETDKVDAELPSPVHGYFLGAVVDPGEVVACGAALALIGNVSLDSSKVESSLSALRADKALLPKITRPAMKTQEPKGDGRGWLFGLALLNLFFWGVEIDEPILYWLSLAVAMGLAAGSLWFYLRAPRRQDGPTNGR